MDVVGFSILALFAVISAGIVVFHRNPVVCALALAFNLATIAGFYLLLHAQFLALLQVIVYAGAIMVLILFVVMLLNLGDDDLSSGRGFMQKWMGLILAAGFAVVLGRAITSRFGGVEFPSISSEFGTVDILGQDLFTRFFYPFEAISLLLIVAMIGAVLLAKRRI